MASRAVLGSELCIEIVQISNICGSIWATKRKEVKQSEGCIS